MPAFLTRLAARRERVLGGLDGIRVADATVGPMGDDFATTGVVGHAASGVLGLSLRAVDAAGTVSAFALDRPVVAPRDDVPVVPGHPDAFLPGHKPPSVPVRDMRTMVLGGAAGSRTRCFVVARQRAHSTSPWPRRLGNTNVELRAV